jgi:transposase InsO family protein
MVMESKIPRRPGDKWGNTPECKWQTCEPLGNDMYEIPYLCPHNRPAAATTTAAAITAAAAITIAADDICFDSDHGEGYESDDGTYWYTDKDGYYFTYIDNEIHYKEDNQNTPINDGETKPDLHYILSAESKSTSVLYTKVKVANRTVPAIVDTGACMNICSYDWLSTLPKAYHKRLKPAVNVHLTAAGGQEMPVVGEIQLPFIFTSRDGRAIVIPLKVIVTQSLPVDVLIGMQLLWDANKVQSIDFDRRALVLKAPNPNDDALDIPIFSVTSTTCAKIDATVRALERVDLTANTSRYVKCRIEGSFSRSEDGTLDPLPPTEKNDKNDFTAHRNGLVRVNPDGTCLVALLAFDNATVYEGQSVCNYTSLTVKDNVFMVFDPVQESHWEKDKKDAKAKRDREEQKREKRNKRTHTEAENDHPPVISTVKPHRNHAHKHNAKRVKLNDTPVRINPQDSASCNPTNGDPEQPNNPESARPSGGTGQAACTEAPAPASDPNANGEDKHGSDDRDSESSSELEALCTKANVPLPQNLNRHQRRTFASLLRKYIKSGAFANHDYDIGRTNLADFQIKLKDPHMAPWAQRAYRLPEKHWEFVRQHLDELEKHGIIEPTSSPWAAPILVVKRPGSSKLRMCCDYRRLNKASVDDTQYPLPLIQNIFDQLANANYFSSIDILQAFHTVPVAEDTKPKLAFTTPFGQYTWNRLPFGPSGGPSHYMRIMDLVLRGLSWQCTIAFIDDLLIYSSTFDNHIRDLDAVLHALQEAGFKIKGSKCHFFQDKIPYLGHIVSAAGLATDPTKIEAITGMPPPKDIAELRRWLAMCGYYRRFIKNYAQQVEALQSLLREGHPDKKLLNLTAEQLQCHENLKKLMTSAPVLKFPDFTKPFTIRTDASDYGIGAVLGQNDEDGHEHPVAYVSRSLTKAERNYEATKREALACHWAVHKQFRFYVYGRHFTLVTDHSALVATFGTKEPPPGQLARWAMDLGGYSFDITHKPGKGHVPPDTLSRTSNLRTTPPDAEPAETESGEGLYNALRNVTNSSLFLVSDASTITEPKALANDKLHAEQRKDAEVKQMIDYLENDILPDNDKEAKRIALLADQFMIKDGILYHIHYDHRPTRTTTVWTQKVIPPRLRQAVLVACHDSSFSGHLDVQRTYARVSTLYYWRRMYSDVKEYVESCNPCATRKSPRSRGQAPLQDHFIPSRPWQYVGVDLLGPITADNVKKWVVVFMCKFTKYPEAFVIDDSSSEIIAKIFVNQIVCRYGAPEYLLSDQGSNVSSHLIEEICKIVNTKKIQTTAYNPQSNGMTERFMSTLATMLSMYAAQHPETWAEHIPHVLFAYRTTIHGVTKDTPFFILHGFDARLPSDPDVETRQHLQPKHREYRRQLITHMTKAREVVFDTLKREAAKALERTNASRKDFDISVGDIVMWKAGSRPKDVPDKWWHPWIGPFRVVRQRNSVVFEIEHMLAPGIMKVAHKNRLKQQDFRANPDPLDGNQTIGIGKRVLNHREVNGKRELLIQLRINGKLTEAWIDPANINYDESKLTTYLQHEVTQRAQRIQGSQANADNEIQHTETALTENDELLEFN